MSTEGKCKYQLKDDSWRVVVYYGAGRESTLSSQEYFRMCIEPDFSELPICYQERIDKAEAEDQRLEDVLSDDE